MAGNQNIRTARMNPGLFKQWKDEWRDQNGNLFPSEILNETMDITETRITIADLSDYLGSFNEDGRLVVDTTTSHYSRWV